MITQTQEYKEKSLIPNTIIEELFLEDAGDHQVKEYVTLADKKRMIHTATAYASKRHRKVHRFFREFYLRMGGNIELMNEMLDRLEAR